MEQWGLLQTMTGKVYFTDGRIEDVITHTFDPANRRNNNEFYFATESGDYTYSQKDVPVTDAMGAILNYMKEYKFYKYTNQWLATMEIDRVEFNMEMI